MGTLRGSGCGCLALAVAHNIGLVRDSGPVGVKGHLWDIGRKTVK
jgi:methylase of polypeptide subunit release factors